MMVKFHYYTFLLYRKKNNSQYNLKVLLIIRFSSYYLLNRPYLRILSFKKLLASLTAVLSGYMCVEYHASVEKR